MTSLRRLGFQGFVSLTVAALSLLPACRREPPIPGSSGGAEGTHAIQDGGELQKVESLFERTMSDPLDLKALAEEWAGVGFELSAVREEGEDLLLLRESASRIEGRGRYMFRRREESPVIALQAPHADFDEHTGAIAKRLMIERRVHAGAWSTASRGEADLSHLANTCFQSFTEAFARRYPSGVILQLHGFDRNKRKLPAARDADLIVSGATRTPPRWVRSLAENVRKRMDRPTRLYPDEVDELGGTTSAQAKLLQQLNHDGFGHVEMSAELRDLLAKDRALRGSFWTAVTESVRERK